MLYHIPLGSCWVPFKFRCNEKLTVAYHMYKPINNKSLARFSKPLSIAKRTAACVNHCPVKRQITQIIERIPLNSRITQI